MFVNIRFVFGVLHILALLFMPATVVDDPPPFHVQRCTTFDGRVPNHRYHRRSIDAASINGIFSMHTQWHELL